MVGLDLESSILAVGCPYRESSVTLMARAQRFSLTRPPFPQLGSSPEVIHTFPRSFEGAFGFAMIVVCLIRSFLLPECSPPP